MTKHEIEQLENYRTELVKTLEKSQDSFERQLSYIAAGGLGLSMIFIEKIVKNLNQAECKWILVVSWLLLALTLVVNLISHLLAAKSVYKTMEEINNNEFESEKSLKRDRFISKLNICSVGTLLLGVLSLILFVTINLYSMKNDTNDIKVPEPQTGQVPSPPPVINPVVPNTSPKK
ncbi:hypothetical protein [Mucilaginibacter sp.]